MTKISAQIKDSSGNSIPGLRLRSGEEISLQLSVDSDATEVLLCATRADFGEEQRPGEDDTTARGNGQELLDEGMIQGRIGSGAWQNICKFENSLNFGALLSTETAVFSIKIVIPTGAETVGLVGVGLGIRCK